MNQTKEKVLAKIDHLQGEMISFLQTLVQHPSMLGNERPAQEVVYRKLKSLGLPVEMWEPRFSDLCTHPAFAPVEWDYNDRPIVTSVWRGKGGGKSLALNGHIDVVNPEPLWGWSHDPWSAQIVGNRMYGRGAADMKGGIAMMILAVQALMQSEVMLKGDVFLETVIEEECGGNGSLACRVRGHAANADAAIVTEDTNLTIGIAELGVMWFRVCLSGSSGHVALAHKSGNVIEACFPLIQALRDLEADMNREATHPNFQSYEHPINLNVGEIKGGHWPSSVPVECSFTCRLSYEPGVTNLEMRKRVEECIDNASQKISFLQENPPRVEYLGFQSEGDCVDADLNFISDLKKSHKTITGKEPLIISFPGTTDMRSFNLFTKTPAICYGPKGDNIHAADEYVELDSLMICAKTLALFMLDWCGFEQL